VTLPNADVSAVGPEPTLPPALTIRKGVGTCLNQPASRALLDALADVVKSPELVRPLPLSFLIK
jgi:hypothetical protein